jgi:hypothetical protein
MDWIESVLTQISQWTHPYYSEISLTILTTILVVYGDVFNKHIKRMISPYHIVIRTLVFILICAFGYGLFVVFVTPYVEMLILWVPYLYRGTAIISIFLVLGYLAENRRYI